MAGRMAKIEDQLMTELQKLKMQMYEKYKRVVSISEVIQMLYDQDPLIMKLINKQ